MAPTLPYGAVALVDMRRRERRADAICKVRSGGRWQVRRARETADGWLLAADNPEWETAP